MTFREILGAFWRRKWIIIAVTLLAMVGAAVFLAAVPPQYTSTTVVRLSPLLSQSVTSGSLAGVAVDADPAVIATPLVLAGAAAVLVEDENELQSAVTQTIVAPTTVTIASTISVQIVTTGETAVQAQDRANAVATAYYDYLAQLNASTLATLNQRLVDASNQAAAFQAQLAGPTVNQIAQANLTTTLSAINALNISISSLQTAGEPLTVSQRATAGASTTPGAMTVLAIALVCGLLAGAGIALIRDHFDDRLKEDDEVEALTGAPVLGVLANDRQVARKKEKLPAGSPQRTTLSEGIRSLRTTIQVLLPDGTGSVLVTSVEPGDGKTLLSANLALSWARSGRKVILVGGDLRRPELGSYFDSAQDYSAFATLLDDSMQTDQLPSQQSVLDSLVSTRFRGLRILPAGVPEGEPADLLAGPATARILDHLTTSADIVVVDSPPALALADASELAAHVTGAIVVARIGRTRTKHLADTVRALEANGAPVFGVVVNRSRRQIPQTYANYFGSNAGAVRPGPQRSTGDVLEDEWALRAGDQGLDTPSGGEAPADRPDGSERVGS